MRLTQCRAQAFAEPNLAGMSVSVNHVEQKSGTSSTVCDEAAPFVHDRFSLVEKIRPLIGSGYRAPGRVRQACLGGLEWLAGVCQPASGD